MYGFILVPTRTEIKPGPAERFFLGPCGSLRTGTEIKNPEGLEKKTHRDKHKAQPWHGDVLLCARDTPRACPVMVCTLCTPGASVPRNKAAPDGMPHVAAWSSGMILAAGARGPGFNSQSSRLLARRHIIFIKTVVRIQLLCYSSVVSVMVFLANNRGWKPGERRAFNPRQLFYSHTHYTEWL